MGQENCCPAQDLQWTQRVVDNQYADIFFCASCGHVHRTEKYAVPTRFPYQGRCINCGGDQRESAEGLRCIQCGKTALEDKEIHDRLAALHPSRQYLEAAVALSELGRHVLALKLSTAEIQWGTDPVNGMVIRIQTLEALSEYDRALDEAYEWADQEGSPPDVFGVIANLEAGVGNLSGATKALERGLNLYPDRHDWWVDYAEIMCHLDDRPGSLRAAQKAVKSEVKEVAARAVVILAEVGERYYAAGLYAEALGACSLAHEHQEKSVELAWLRARIAATNQDLDYLVKWLEVTVALDPNHAEALAMLEPYKRSQGGWFGGWK
jgi:tetratricopeptide (TPR) repeat protein